MEYLLVVVSYLIGCASPGYLLVRRTTGADVRSQHTGSTGARNAGRVAGWRVAAAVFALDLAKGALAVAIGRLAGLDEGWLSVSLVAVVAGHVLPVQLRFRGGRGLSTALGAMLVLNPAAALIGLVTAVVVALGARQVTVAGLAGMTAAPVAALLLGVRGYELAGLTATTVLVLAAHA